MQEERKLCSIIVPCYNEEEAIPLYYQEMLKIFIELPELQFEFVFIDDGSRDHTLQTVKELHEKDERVHYVSFSRNFGKEAGIYAGLEHSSGDYIVIMDVDLQDPPEMLRQMYDSI
ncbi:MAG: glycosyltransferase, partial [Lachnospiraceae bacterium]|nr:glycosyltransferase [Lachnospiraceae bacterium]